MLYVDVIYVFSIIQRVLPLTMHFVQRMERVHTPHVARPAFFGMHCQSNTQNTLSLTFFFQIIGIVLSLYI